MIAKLRRFKYISDIRKIIKLAVRTIQIDGATTDKSQSATKQPQTILNSSRSMGISSS